MKKHLLIIALVALSSLTAMAQPKPAKSSSSSGNTSDNTFGLGLKFGSPSGISLKHYNSTNAWDLTVSAWGNAYRPNYYRNYDNYVGINMTFLYEWRRGISNAGGLEWYYGIGPGVSINTYRETLRDNRGYYYEDRSNVGVSVVGVLGLEYIFSDAPFTIFAEISPAASIVPAVNVYVMGNIGGRFTF